MLKLSESFGCHQASCFVPKLEEVVVVTESLRMTDFDHASYIIDVIKAHQKKYGIPMPRRVLLSVVQSDKARPLPTRCLARTVMYLLNGLESAGNVTVGPEGLSVVEHTSSP